MADLDLTIRSCESRLSLGSLILLAHSPNYSLSIPSLTAFFPVILSSVQSNTALDEILSLLITCIVPLRSQTPPPDLPSDLAVSLAHVLSLLAGVHPDPSTRHHVFRLISAVLTLTPSPLRLHLLQGLLTDSESSPQMRVAAVGLVREAVLEALATSPGSAESSRNVFASPLLLQTIGPIVLSTNPPDLLTAGNLQPKDFLGSSEPLRLVECLAFYYVLLQRDIHNRVSLCSHIF